MRFAHALESCWPKIFAFYFLLILIPSSNLRAASIEHRLSKEEVDAWMEKEFATTKTILFRYQPGIASAHEWSSDTDDEIYLFKNKNIFRLETVSLGLSQINGQYQITPKGTITFMFEERPTFPNGMQIAGDYSFPESYIYRKGKDYFMTSVRPEVSALEDSTFVKSELPYKQITERTPDEAYYCWSHDVALMKITRVWPLPFRDLYSYYRIPYIKKSSLYEDKPLGVSYKVLESFKGDPTREGIVYTSAAQAECGVDLKPGSNAILEIDENGFFPNCGNGKLNLDESSLKAISAKYRNIKKAYLKNPEGFCDKVKKKASQTGFLD